MLTEGGASVSSWLFLFSGLLIRNPWKLESHGSFGNAPSADGGWCLPWFFHSERNDCPCEHIVSIIFFSALISSDISTTWSAILRDCADPDVFRPQRYLDDDSLPDPFEVIFGFGRRWDERSFFVILNWYAGGSRICPGRHLAESSYWGIASSMIAAFDISKALDPNGREINIPLEFTHGFVRYGFLFLLNYNVFSI